MPQVAGSLPDPEPEVEPEGGDEDRETLPALIRNATAFDAEDARALLAVVLVPDADTPLDVSAVASLPMPVAVALDPTQPESGETARRLRAEGIEIVLQIDGVLGPELGDRLTEAHQALPDSVAFLDGADARLQGDRAALDATLAQMAVTGHGLLVYPRGFSSAERVADLQGLSAATLFRDLSAVPQDDWRRVLDRAGVAAGLDGGAVVVAPATPDMLAELVGWALGDRSEGMELAPVSAVLQRR